MYYLKWKRHDVDPCLFVKWEKINGLNKLIVFLLWVDDCLICGPQQFVKKKANEFSRLFDVTNEKPDGNLTEYVGNKIKQNDKRIRLIQPTKIQHFIDKFGYGKKEENAPAAPGSVLAVDAQDDEPVTKEQHNWYCSIAGITNHMALWSRPDVQNTQRKVSQFLQGPTNYV